MQPELPDDLGPSTSSEARKRKEQLREAIWDVVRVLPTSSFGPEQKRHLDRLLIADEAALDRSPDVYARGQPQSQRYAETLLRHVFQEIPLSAEGQGLQQHLTEISKMAGEEAKSIAYHTSNGNPRAQDAVLAQTLIDDLLPQAAHLDRICTLLEQEEASLALAGFFPLLATIQEKLDELGDVIDKQGTRPSDRLQAATAVFAGPLNGPDRRPPERVIRRQLSRCTKRLQDVVYRLSR